MPRTKQFDTENTLVKARDLFWSKGYYNTSIQDLVNALGINRASIYDTYGGKKELFDLAFKQYQESNFRWLKAYLESRSKTVETLREFFYGTIESGCTDPENKGCFGVNTTTELIPSDEWIQKLMLKQKKRVEEVFESFLEQGKAEGEFNKSVDAKNAARLLFTLLSGFRVVGKIKPRKEEMQASMDLVLSLLK
ncbi:MAG: TetR family transcriptional regulator [Crocinitomicaceae bacterium]|nr:TetR family transcriptional regulator [Crocinitomicaceae bacterium]|tara:strand:- start:923 stop:1504 length:582 start_codon:yes stop_codon:yes gene_type:complete